MRMLLVLAVLFAFVTPARAQVHCESYVVDGPSGPRRLTDCDGFDSSGDHRSTLADSILPELGPEPRLEWQRLFRAQRLMDLCQHGDRAACDRLDDLLSR